MFENLPYLDEHADDDDDDDDGGGGGGGGGAGRGYGVPGNGVKNPHNAQWEVYIDIVDD